MPTDFQQFLDTAADLLAANKREADLRASISRSYYSVFLRFRDKRSDFKLSDKVRIMALGKPVKHEKLIHELKGADDAAIQEIGENLHSLYAARLLSDYDYHLDVELSRAANEHKNATALHHDINRIGLKNLASRLEAHLLRKYAASFGSGRP